MKTIILFALLLLISSFSMGQCPTNPSVAHPDTVEVGLQYYKVLDGATVTVTGPDTFLVLTGCCFVFKKELRIPINDTTGVRLSDDQSSMLLPNYYSLRVNGCAVPAYDTKEEFYLVSGLQYPYGLVGGQVRNLVKAGLYGYNPREWDWLKSYGRQSSYTYWSAADTAFVPDTMMAYAPPAMCTDPYYDSVTAVGLSYTDCYSSNKFLINGIGDGVFSLRLDINLPATNYDPGMYPNFFEHNFRKTGIAFEWTTDPVTVCCTDPIPAAPDKVTIKGNTMLTWRAVTGAEEYYIYARMAFTDPGQPNKVLGWHTWQAVTEVDNTSVTVPALPGIWQYGVSSEGCAGESEITVSRKD